MTTPAGGSSSSAAVRGRRSQPVPRLGHICFPCSDCDLTFPTHQGLGGHRKLHTKLLDPNLRKLPRRQRRKVSISVAHTAPSAPTEINQKSHEEEEDEWQTVEVKISDHGMAGGSNAGGTAGGTVKEVVKMELDLTLHL